MCTHLITNRRRFDLVSNLQCKISEYKSDTIEHLSTGDIYIIG